MDYFITGSRAYGPYTEDSDLDIVMLKEDAERLKQIVELQGLHTLVLDKSFAYSDQVWYFGIGGLLINVIDVKSKVDFECWKEVTRRMVLMPDIEKKEERVETFKDLFVKVHNGYPATIGSLWYTDTPTREVIYRIQQGKNEIIVYQDYAYPNRVLPTLRGWEGYFFIDFFATEKIVKKIMADSPINVGKHFHGFDGIAHIKSVTQSMPIRIDFVGSGKLREGGKEVTGN